MSSINLENSNNQDNADTTAVLNKDILKNKQIESDLDTERTRSFSSNTNSIQKVAKPPISTSTSEIDVHAEITHGDLSLAQHPIIIGHYDGDQLGGAEKSADRMLKGLLTESFQLGLYPGPIRTTETFIKKDHPNEGVVVTGLGMRGMLTATKLQYAISHALLNFTRAFINNESSKNVDPVVVKLSIIQAGSGKGGLSLNESNAAIFRAIYQSIRKYKAINSIKKVQLHIEFIELFLDRAVQNLRIIQRLKKSDEFCGLIQSVNPQLNIRNGGRERVAFVEEDSWWRRIQIISKDDGSLKFTRSTHRARAEAELVKTQRELIDRVINNSIKTIHNDESLASTLFQLLMPQEFKQNTSDQGNVLLILNEVTARYPWELLQQRSAQENLKPLSIQAGMIRQLELDDYRRQPKEVETCHNLIIGDPELKNKYDQLPGAEKEAKAVAQALGKNNTTLKIRAEAEDIIQTLFAKPYQIIHIAGHGVHEHQMESGELVSGVVLSDDLFLTPREISQLPTTPEIVFINCCHLGNTTRKDPLKDPHKLAANLASQLILNGVHCVIAAGWAVEDEAATKFAEVFYKQIINNKQSFGSSVLAARNAVYEDHPEYNTWGAYQCYGDPDFKIDRNTEQTDEEISLNECPFSIPRELILEMQNIRQDAALMSTDEKSAASSKIDSIEKLLPNKWDKNVKILSAFGLACSSIGEHKKAIDFYNRAVSINPTKVPIKYHESLAKIEIKSKTNTWRKTDRKPAELQKELDPVIKKIRTLGEFAPSVKQQLILGNAYKQLAIAWRDTSDKRLGYIDEMIQSYNEAFDLANKREKTINTEALLNWSAGMIAKDWRSNEDEIGDRDTWNIRVSRMKDQVKNKNSKHLNIIAEANFDLVQLLSAKRSQITDNETLESRFDKIFRKYRKAIKQDGANECQAHIIDTVGFLLDMSDRRRTRAANTANRHLAKLKVELDQDLASDSESM